MQKEVRIVVEGLCPGDHKGTGIDRIEQALQKVITDLPQFDITPYNISFTFPIDPSITTKQVKVFIRMELLFSQPIMTPEDRRAIARNTGLAFLSIPGNSRRRVGALVEQRDPKNASYWSTDQ